MTRYSVSTPVLDAAELSKLALFLLNTPMSTVRVREKAILAMNAFVREHEDKTSRVIIKASLKREHDRQINMAKACLVVGKELERFMQTQLDGTSSANSRGKRRKLANEAMVHEHVADLFNQFINSEFPKGGRS